MNTESTSDKVLITHLINAPRELVFEAWTNPEHLSKWYVPEGATTKYLIADIRTGGSFHSCLTTETGYQCWVKGEYLEVKKPERIVQNMIMSNEKGETVPPSERGMDPEWPQETLLTVTFKEMDGKTMIKLEQVVSEKLARKTGAYGSWFQMFESLEKFLK